MTDKRGHRQAREAPAKAARLDAILAASAPVIEEARVEALVLKLVAAAGKTPAPVPMAAPALLWSLRQWAPTGVVYLGLLVLGGVLNLLTPLPPAATPLDLLFSGNLLPSPGGWP